MNKEEFLEEYVLDDCREEAKKQLDLLLSLQYLKGVNETSNNKND